MTRIILLLSAGIIGLLCSCAEPGPGRRDLSRQIIAVWRDTKSERVALAIDLSLGDYPPEGQKNFKTLDEAISYLKLLSTRHGDLSDPAFEYIVFNGHPSGAHYQSVGELNKDDFRKLLNRLDAVELLW